LIDENSQDVVPGEMRIAEQERDDVCCGGPPKAMRKLSPSSTGGTRRPCIACLRMNGKYLGAEEIVQDVFIPDA